MWLNVNMHPLECMRWDQSRFSRPGKKRENWNIRLVHGFQKSMKNMVIHLNSEWVHLIAAFALHLTLNRIHVMWRELGIVRTYMTCEIQTDDWVYRSIFKQLSHCTHTGMHEIRGISNHRSVDSHTLMTLSPTRWALWLMKAACKPLYHNITGAGHFFWFHSIDHVKFKQGSNRSGSVWSEYQNQSQRMDTLTWRRKNERKTVTISILWKINWDLNYFYRDI